MAITLLSHAFVQSVLGTAVTSAIDTSGGTLLITGKAWYAGDVDPTLSDSKSNTWTPLTAYGTLAGTCRTKAKISHVLPTPIVGTGHTFSFGGAGTAMNGSCLAAAFSGISAFDRENGFADTAVHSTIQPGSITPSVNGCLILALLSWDDNNGSPTISIDSGFTIIDNAPWSNTGFQGGTLAYLVQSVAAPVNPTWTRTNTFSSFSDVAAIASFTPSALGSISLSEDGYMPSAAPAPGPVIMTY